MDNKQDIVKLLGSMYPNAKDLLNDNELEVGDYSVVDNFALFKGAYLKKASGHFHQFVIDLFEKASSRAPDTIKHYFKLPKDEVKLDYSGDSALYVLARGMFGDDIFVVKATSGHKYDKEHYIIEKTK